MFLQKRLKLFTNIFPILLIKILLDAHSEKILINLFNLLSCKLLILFILIC